mmetsp:Transcript_30246/g.58130  ORF Transcript_30246/g.58130 Transcript_30246/m.58130 type:complete len:266 (-) Transcript_30246:441-1238(-)
MRQPPQRQAGLLAHFVDHQGHVKQPVYRVIAHKQDGALVARNIIHAKKLGPGDPVPRAHLWDLLHHPVDRRPRRRARQLLHRVALELGKLLQLHAFFLLLESRSLLLLSSLLQKCALLLLRRLQSRHHLTQRQSLHLLLVPVLRDGQQTLHRRTRSLEGGHVGGVRRRGAGGVHRLVRGNLRAQACCQQRLALPRRQPRLLPGGARGSALTWGVAAKHGKTLLGRQQVLLRQDVHQHRIRLQEQRVRRLLHQVHLAGADERRQPT